jgi:hypothetical protein
MSRRSVGFGGDERLSRIGTMIAVRGQAGRLRKPYRARRSNTMARALVGQAAVNSTELRTPPRGTSERGMGLNPKRGKK